MMAFSRRQLALLGLLALAEASVIQPVLLLFPTPLRLVDRGVALLITWLLLGLIGFSRRTLAQYEATLTAQRAALGAWLAGMLAISALIIYRTGQFDPRSLSVLFIQFAGVLIVWWRGISLGVVQFGPDSARLRLQMGLLVFVMIAVATLFDPTYDLMGFVLPFLIGAIFALPLSHIEYVERNPQGRLVPMDARWWRSLGFSISIPLFGSIALAAVLTGDTIGAGVRLLLSILLIPILAVAFIVGYIISLILAFLFGNLKRNPLEALNGLNDLANQLRGRPDQNTLPPFTLSPELRFALGVLALVIIAGILIWLTGRARRETAIIRATGDDLIDLGTEDVPPLPMPVASILNSLSLRRWLAALTIRRIYARMSHEAGKRGLARLAAQTPNDYLPRVCEAFPGAPDDVRIITDAYIAAHYGEVPDSDEALAKISNAWQRVRAIPRPAPKPAEAPVQPA